jgi:hypothetical protein
LARKRGKVRHPPRSGWLDELGRLKDGRSMGLAGVYSKAFRDRGK